MISRYLVVVASTAGESVLCALNDTSGDHAATRAVEIARAAAAMRPAKPSRDGRKVKAAKAVTWWAAAVIAGLTAVDMLEGHEGHYGTIHRDPIEPVMGRAT